MHTVFFSGRFKDSSSRSAWNVGSSPVRHAVIFDTSLDWPKDFPTQDRKINPGVGVGFEIFFGTDEFLARPITF